MEILQKAAIIAALIAAVMTGKIEGYQGNDTGAAEKELVIVVDGEKFYPSDEDINNRFSGPRRTICIRSGWKK